MKAQEVKKRLEADSWVEFPGTSSGHRHFKHPKKKGKITIPFHPGDLNPITLKSIEKQSGVSMK